MIPPNAQGYADGDLTIEITDQETGCVIEGITKIVLEECACLDPRVDYDCETGLTFSSTGVQGTLEVRIGSQLAQNGAFYNNGTYTLTFTDTDAGGNVLCQEMIQLTIDCSQEDCDDIFSMGTPVITDN